MRSFRQFIVESAVTRLYHGTPVQNLDKIMKTGIKPVTHEKVYASDNFEEALDWGKNRTTKWARLHGVEKTDKMQFALITLTGEGFTQSGEHFISKNIIPPASFLKIEIFTVGEFEAAERRRYDTGKFSITPVKTIDI